MKVISLAIFIAAFFLLRPYALQDNGMWYAGDDYHYFAESSALAFGQYPSYQHEFLLPHVRTPLTSVGPGILAAPFVFVFSFFDRWEGSTIADHRTYDNVERSWSQFGFIVSSVFYLSLGCLLLYVTCLEFGSSWEASWAVIFMVICQGMPLYSFRRPIFSHATEFFIQSLMIYLFLRDSKLNGQFINHWLKFAGIGALVAMLFLVRYNNFAIAITWLLLFLAPMISKNLQKLLSLAAALLAFFFVTFFFKVWPELYNHFHAYKDPLSFIRVSTPAGEILKRVVHIFFGLDWGFLWTAPFLILGVWGLIKYHITIKRKLCLIALPLLINFVVIVLFGTQGGWYGYRYFIASAFPVFVIPLTVLLGHCRQHYGQKILWIFILISLFPIFSMWCFEGNATTLTLHLIPQYFGRVDWSNNTYQISVWRTLMSIHQALLVLFKGGPYYILYLLSLTKILPQHVVHSMEFSLKFPYYEWKILFRVLVIYLVPWTVCAKPVVDFFSRTEPSILKE